MDIVWDYVIIGGGFSGLFLKKLMEEKSINHCLIESKMIGGQLNLYLPKYIHDIPGIVAITGQQLLDQVTNDSVIFMEAQSIEIDQNYKIIHGIGDQPMAIKTKHIIAATGKGIIKPVTFNYVGLEKVSPWVHYALIKKDYGNKTIAVLGGGDSALDSADFVKQQGGNVILIHRRNLTAMEGKINKVANGIKIMTNCTINFFDYDGGVIIDYTWDGVQASCKVDEVIMAYGVVTDNNNITNLWQSQEKLWVNKTTMEVVNNPLVDFAIGDSAMYENKRFLIHNYITECHRLINHIGGQD
jgi:thioredoxin reductase (NADPH)